MTFLKKVLEAYGFQVSPIAPAPPAPAQAPTAQPRGNAGELRRARSRPAPAPAAKDREEPPRVVARAFWPPQPDAGAKALHDISRNAQPVREHDQTDTDRQTIDHTDEGHLAPCTLRPSATATV